MKKNIITFSKSGASASKIRNIKWDAKSSLNNFTKSGQYYITGYRASGTDSLPIANIGEWHNISALLTVTDSGEADTMQRNRIVGQTLILSNRVGGETKIFTRSCNMVLGSGLWTLWSTMQGLREVGGVSPVDIASYTDSGLYSGAITDSELTTMPMMPGTTFLLVVINNSQLAAMSGSSRVRACTQLMYVLPYSYNASLETMSEGSIYLRTGLRSATTGIYEWGEWKCCDNRMQLLENQLTGLNLSGDVNGVISDDGSIATTINPKAPIIQEISMVLNILLEAQDSSDNIKSTMRQYVGTAVGEMVDEEDITLDSDNHLRLKDRIYSEGTGMGYVILRRGKSFASQMTAANTIYEIRYDFDLAGEEVAIPEGCTLKFEGGRLMNGTIELANTEITALGVQLFDNLIVRGMSRQKGKVAWFGAVAESSPTYTDNCNYIQHALNSSFPIIEFDVGYYYVEGPLYLKYLKSLHLKGICTNPITPSWGNAGNTYKPHTDASIIWTDKNIDVLSIQLPPADTMRSDAYTININGGAIDVSSCENYTRTAITIYGTVKRNVYPNVTTSVLSNPMTIAKHDVLSYSCGIKIANIICEDEIPENSGFLVEENCSVYGGYISSYTLGFDNGIKFSMRNVKVTWNLLTNIYVNLQSERCRFAIDLGNGKYQGNSGGVIAGWVQPAEIFTESENGEVCILGNLKNVTIETFFWDLCINKGTIEEPRYTSQYSMDVGYNIYNMPILTSIVNTDKIKGNKISAYSLRNTNIEIRDVLGHPISYEKHYCELVSNYFYGLPCNVKTINCSVTGDYLTDGLKVYDITENSSIIITIDESLPKYQRISNFFALLNANVPNVTAFTQVDIEWFYNKNLISRYSETLDELGDTNFQVCINAEINAIIDKIVVIYSKPKLGSNNQCILGGEGKVVGHNYEHIITRNGGYIGEDKSIYFGEIDFKVNPTYIKAGNYVYAPRLATSFSDVNVAVSRLSEYADGSPVSVYNSNYQHLILSKASSSANYLFDYRGRRIYNRESLRYYGTFAQKPDNTVDINIPIGFDYFCTDRTSIDGNRDGIMIYYTGSGIWVDALGRIIE